MRNLRHLFCFLLLASSSGLLAGGFQVSLHGQKQIGMGSVGTSLVHDASCMFFNPGGLAMMKQKVSVSGGVSFLRSYAVFSKDNTDYQAETNNPMGTPFTFYAAMRVNEKLAAGLAVNTPYGNRLKWGDHWAGRYLIQDISLASVFFQPTLSYKIHPNLSLGAGLVYALGNVDMNKAVPVSSQGGQDGKVNIKGSGSSFGYNLGLLFRKDKLSIGIDYRSRVDMELDEADASFQVPASLSGNFPADNKTKVSLPLPANLDIGASYALSDKLTAGFSLNYVFWEVYDSLIFDFQTNTPALADSRNPREYKNRLIVRVGAQYAFSDKLTVRAGGYYDPTPVNPDYFNPETPSLDITALSCGFSYYPMEKLSIDASFLYLMGSEMQMQYQPENFGGTYKTRIYIPGIGISYGF
ncbi:MAG TPA: outer membrane protein transport protein [Bacteroidales bacterium]|nr:outer membrane protein transport protein [Bacteroidales bacterium]HSA44730.1 outer membrane protein transport protein [Bacteroidales bacterium]